MQRVLITGAAGFIGAATAQRLLGLGYELLGIDNLNSYYDVSLKHARLARLKDQPRFRFIEADLADRESTQSAFAAFKPEGVIHLAAQAGVRYSLENPFAYTHSNVEGTLAVLEACRAHPVTHLVYASSSSVYGANTKVPFSETDTVNRPVSLYAATKRANELMAQTYAHLYRVPASGLRFFTVYGPWGRPDMAYFKFTDAIFHRQPIDIYNNGHMWRDFTYIDEVVEAIGRLIVQPPADRDSSGEEPGRIDASVPHRLFNIGNHTPVALGDFVETLERLIGRTADKRMLPMQPGDVERTYADVSALERAVGFAPSTRIEEGLARFVSWYREFCRL
ncbi:MAG TPA: SDR family NAD(P)-dependent oxidoreductase [Rhizomicrobium sp.]|jgi:UDP-glucuronate 4-epimerase